MKRRGFGKVFAFTFRQHAAKKSYKTSIAIGVLLCLLAPMLVMTCIELLGDGKTYIPAVTMVCVVDNSLDYNTAIPIEDIVDNNFNILNTTGREGLTNVDYLFYGTEFDAALAMAQTSNTKTSLVMVIDKVDGSYAVRVLLPENTELKRRDANAFSDFINDSFRFLLMQRSGLDAMSFATLATPVSSEVTTYSPEDDQAEDGQMSSDIRQIFTMVIGYVLVMVIYFLVLLYGQGVANAVIMEKNSKLMELFLLSVDPVAMVTGKVLATALAGAIQFTSWVVGLICGFAGGTIIVKALNPASDMMLITVFESIGAVTGMFSVGGIVVALLILLAGFLLYCSLAAIGGALAGKPEDLSSTNLIFTLVLVVSFFAIIFSGGLTGEIDSLNPVLLWIPFTGVLTAPSQLILGVMPALAGLGVLAVTVGFSLLLMTVAGKLYVALVHHRGNPPDFGTAFRMLKKQ